MKRIRTTREVLADVRRVLAETPLRVGSRAPLSQVEEVLRDGRRFGAVAIRLGESPAASGALTIPIALGTLTLGALHVESDGRRPHANAVLLKQAACELARYLRGRGKYLVREARGRAPEPLTLPRREPQPEREPAGVASGRRAAAGDTARS